jgi:hypothetical protein
MASAAVVQVGDLGAAYLAGATGDAGDRRRAVRQFRARFGTIEQWRATSPTDQLAASPAARAFAAFAAVGAGVAVDATYVVGAASKWGRHVADRDLEQVARFRLQASSLGFDQREVDKMWSKLAQISVIIGTSPDSLTSEQYLSGREAFRAAVTAKHGRAPKSLTTPLFGLGRGDVPPRPGTPPRPTGAVADQVGARNRLGPDRRPGAGAGGHHAPLPRPAPCQPAGLIGCRR